MSKNNNKPIKENIFGAAKRFSDAFFDGLKQNATNKAILAAKKNPKVPVAIVDKMERIAKAAKELERDLQYLDPK
jgi:hypothetical protein